MILEKKRQKAVKFNRLKEAFGCGYWAVCCGNRCPCRYKYHDQQDQDVYYRLRKDFDQEGKELFG